MIRKSCDRTVVVRLADRRSAFSAAGVLASENRGVPRSEREQREWFLVPRGIARSIVVSVRADRTPFLAERFRVPVARATSSDPR